MRKIAFLPPAIVLIVNIIFRGVVYAAPATQLSLSPSSSTIQIDEAFTINVVMNTNGNQIVSADVVLIYDPHIFEAISATTSTSFVQNIQEVQPAIIDNTGGKISYSVYTDRTNAANGQGVLVAVTLKGKGSGTTSLAFDMANTLVYGISEGNVLTSASSGSYTISGPTPTPTQPGPTSPPSTSSSGGGGSGGGGGGDSGGGAGESSGGGSNDSGGGNTSSIPGDLNNDGKVNVFDLSILLRNWGRGGTGDTNGSGKVDVFDLSIQLRHWSK